MADFDSSLPIRTENPGDAIVKIADATTPSQQLAVEADGSINVNATISATNLDIRDLVFATDKVDVSGSAVTATVSATNLDIRDLAFATDKVDVSGSAVTVSATDLDVRDLAFATDKVDVSGSSVTATVSATNLDIRDLVFATDKIDVSGSAVTVSATNLDIRDLAFATDKVDVTGSDVTATVTATNLDIRDLTHVSDSVKVGDGTDFLAVNANGSINVVISDASGDEINDYDTAAAVAGGASDNHDYTVTALKTLMLSQIEASGSGKAKIEVQIETGAATNTFVSRFVQFNSTSSPNMSLMLKAPIAVAAGVRVRVIRTNRDNQAQDLYSTISGNEV